MTQARVKQILFSAIGAAMLASTGCGAVEPEELQARAGCAGGATCAAGPIQPFVMFSSYRLAPYADRYVRSAMFALGQRNVAGVVYATLGFTEQLFADGISGGLPDEVAYNESLFSAAHGADADLWLQVRAYDNVLTVGAEHRNFTADEIIEDPAVKAAFLAKVNEVVTPYASNFAGRCKIVACEENSIYHHLIGSGGFWAGPQWDDPDGNGFIVPSALYDQLYIDRVSDVFRMIRKEVRAIDPDCDVGLHFGHAPLYRQVAGRSLLGNVFKALGGNKPDFVFYDLYVKAQPDHATFANKLRDRFDAIAAETNRPIYYLGQLHTTNNFQHGEGRSPSKHDIDESVAIAVEKGAVAVGWYTKNTRATFHCDAADVANGLCHPEDLTPLFPNYLTHVQVGPGLWEPQKTVYESSLDRWDYGVARLMEARGDDRADYFDVVLDGTGLGPGNYELRIWNYDDGAWDLAGVMDAVDRGLPSTFDYAAHSGAVAIRGIDHASHCRPGGVHLRLDRAEPGATGTLQSAYVLPFGGAFRFYSENGLNTRIASGELPGLAIDHVDVNGAIGQRRFVHLPGACP